MKFQELRNQVLQANREIVTAGLVLLTWGNASAVDREERVMAIKPSGVSYDELSAETIPIVALDTGTVLDGVYKPSSDTATHLELYREFADLGAIVHTHSHYAVCFAQAEQPIPCLGTTHADHFLTEIPVTRRLTENEIQGEYEKNTGSVIVELFERDGYVPLQTAAALVAQHGPFAWGATVQKAVENAIVLEEVARMSFHTRAIAPAMNSADRKLVERHFFRKHGAGAYYGQE